jgi:tRNA-specific adenosine deaminase 1
MYYLLSIGSNAETYLQLKLLASSYQIAKEKLMGDGRPFVGWLVSGSQWQEFNRNGESSDGIE